MPVSLQLRPIIDNSNELLESPLLQSSGEEILYSLDVSSYGTGATSPLVTVINSANGVDVTAQVVSVAASVLSDVIAWGISGLLRGFEYKVSIAFTLASGIPFVRYLRVDAHD